MDLFRTSFNGKPRTLEDALEDEAKGRLTVRKHGRLLGFENASFAVVQVLIV